MLTDLLTRALDGLGEDVSDADRVLAEDVGVDAQGHGGVGVAEAGGDHVEGDARYEQFTFLAQIGGCLRQSSGESLSRSVMAAPFTCHEVGGPVMP